MSVFQIYCKNLKTSNISISSFDVDIFQKYLEVYEDAYCSFKNNKNIKEYIDKINSTISNYVKVGRYFLNHKNIFYQLKKIKERNPNSYLVVPAYNTCFDCELQIGVTGTIKMGERPLNCIKREVEEELGLIVSTKDIKVNPKIKNVYYYEVHIKKNFIVKRDSIVNLKYKKETKYKISCLVYGNLIDTRNFLTKSKLQYHFIENENISHTLLVPIDLAIIITDKIMSFRSDRNHAIRRKLY